MLESCVSVRVAKLASRPKASKPHLKASAKSLTPPKPKTVREQTAAAATKRQPKIHNLSPQTTPRKSRARDIVKSSPRGSPKRTGQVQTTPKRSKTSPKTAKQVQTTPQRSKIRTAEAATPRSPRRSRSPKVPLRLSLIHPKTDAKDAPKLSSHLQLSTRSSRRSSGNTSRASPAVEVEVLSSEETDNPSSLLSQERKNHYLTKTVKLRMAAQSGKLFQEILCESRSHPVESTDPVAAKTIDDLKKQVSRQRAEIEAERVKLRELQRSHEKEIRMVREDLEKERDRSLEALSCRKDNEKVAEVAQVKERLIKQNQHELRTQRGDLEDEMRRLERRLTKEREETMRKVLNLERKKTEEEAAHHMLEDTVMTREEHLKAEIFRLGEDVERLEFQVGCVL